MRPEPVTRSQVLGYRLRVNHLIERLAHGDLDKAAYVGFQDSVPRSALLALHARVEDVRFDSWDDPKLVQVWGPRGSVYVVPKSDFAVFTLGRLPRDADRRRQIEDDARRVRELLEVLDRPGLETATGGSVRRVREIAATGRIRIRWDGSSIDVWADEPPDADIEACRMELARRYLQAFAPATASSFAAWAGIDRQDAADTWSALRAELIDFQVNGSVRQALSEADGSSIADEGDIPESTRLLPPGDPYLLARDREILVPDSEPRARLWARNNVPPGGLIVDGELAGTWRRKLHSFTISTWRPLTTECKSLIETEIRTMPSLGTAESRVEWKT